RRPFWNRDHDVDLIIDVCDGLRPPIVTNAPEGYVEIMQECWHSNPKRRPTAADILSRIESIHISEYTKQYNGSPTISMVTSDISKFLCWCRVLDSAVPSKRSKSHIV
ncbi:18911_t:CDS:2, partial [Funneliformis geosporum]